MRTILNKIITIFREDIWEFLKHFLFKITHLADDTDVDGTINSIRSGVVLEGSNLWMLICSSIIACIGLDTNSPAVIIGAMLISPLMSPILGLGLCMGINDREYLIKSTKNFAIAIGLSLFVSWLYFHLTPFGEYTPEMQGRTEPTLLDAGVAFFGGLAGIIAGSRTEKSNPIPGVAIATALMPPLCTSGFGLATGRWEVFGGAFYLFGINALLISASTYLIVRWLKFPQINMETEENKSVYRKNRVVILFFISLLLLPSIIFMVKKLWEAREGALVKEFIAQNIHKDVEKGTTWEWEHTSVSDSLATLKVYYFGEYIDADSVKKLEIKLVEQLDYGWWLLKFIAPDASKITLNSSQVKPDEERKKIQTRLAKLKDRMDKLENVNAKKMQRKNSELDSLRHELQLLTADSIPFLQIKSEIKALYPELEKFAVGKTTLTTFDSTNRLSYAAIVAWKPEISPYQLPAIQKRISSYLKVKLKADTVYVVNYPK